MFLFEDPVGVQLVQAADGTLTGRGCDAFAAGGPNFDMLVTPDLCGDIAGQVRGREASFGFTFTYARYSVRVTISDDGRRMAGVFNNGMGDIDTGSWALMAWLRVDDDDDWLPRADGQPAPAVGAYDLTLLAGANPGNEFVTGKTYNFGYTNDGIWGDLGCFWHSEISSETPAAATSAIHVGPVSATDPALPTSLLLEGDPDEIRSVTATTGSGGIYTFVATRRR